MEISRTQSFELMNLFKCWMQVLGQLIGAPAVVWDAELSEFLHLLPDWLYSVVVSLSVVSCYCTTFAAAVYQACMFSEYYRVQDVW